MILTSQHTQSLHAQFRPDDTPEPRPLVPIAKLEPASYEVPPIELWPHTIMGEVRMHLEVSMSRASDWQRPLKRISYTSPLLFQWIGSDFLKRVLEQEFSQKQDEILRKVHAWEKAAKRTA